MDEQQNYALQDVLVNEISKHLDMSTLNSVCASSKYMKDIMMEKKLEKYMVKYKSLVYYEIGRKKEIGLLRWLSENRDEESISLRGRIYEGHMKAILRGGIYEGHAEIIEWFHDNGYRYNECLNYAIECNNIPFIIWYVEHEYIYSKLYDEEMNEYGETPSWLNLCYYSDRDTILIFKYLYIHMGNDGFKLQNVMEMLPCTYNHGWEMQKKFYDDVTDDPDYKDCNISMENYNEYITFYVLYVYYKELFQEIKVDPRETLLTRVKKVYVKFRNYFINRNNPSDETIKLRQNVFHRRWASIRKHQYSWSVWECYERDCEYDDHKHIYENCENYEDPDEAHDIIVRLCKE